MTTAMHLGDARRRAIGVLSSILETDEAVEKAVLVHDLHGLLRVIVWVRPGADEQAVSERVATSLEVCERFWTGDVWVRSAATSRADRLVYDAAWDEGIGVPGVDRLRIDDRIRTRSAWLPLFREPPWRPRSPAARDTAEQDGPRIVVFYSFKGGMGRTTALAALAVQRARKGERVLVIDFDLDAPGAGTLLAGDGGHCARGVVDYLLEAPLGEVDIEDYVHRCTRPALTRGEDDEERHGRPREARSRNGEIIIMPAGRVDEDYVTKLSRLDLEIRSEERPLDGVLRDAREKLRPDWILIDSRAGLSPAAGLLLDGTAHLHVVFGTTSAQNQLGLAQVLRWLGLERARRGFVQAECVVVHAMGVDIVAVEKPMQEQFNEWLERTLRERYVAPEDMADDRLWSLRDLDGPRSPCRAVWIPYWHRMAFFSRIDDVADDLVSGRYLELGERIHRHFEDLDISRDETADPRL